MSQLWFLADLPILVVAMGCYGLAGIWTFHEWKFRRPPAAHNAHHPATSNGGGGSTTVTSRGRTIHKSSPSPVIASSTQRSKGQSTRELFFKCTFFALMGRFALMPVQAWYYHFDDFAVKNPGSNLLCIPNSAGCVVSRTLPDVLFASAFFVLLILYAQLIATICGVPMMTSSSTSNNNTTTNHEYHPSSQHQPLSTNTSLSRETNLNRQQQQQQQPYNNNHNSNHNNNNYNNHSADTTPERAMNNNNNNNNGSSSFHHASPNNPRSILTCHERILLNVMHHKSTFSTTNIIMYSIYGLCLFFSAIIPIISFSKMQQILWIMMSMVYATCFLITLVWVLPALYQQFHIKMSDKPKNRQKLHFKMWTSSLICLFVYGGRTINFIWNLVRSWNGQFYSSDDTKQYDHFTSFFNTSLGRDAVLNLCLELIPACIIVHLMRSPTRKQQQHQQQEQHQSSTPPIATVLHNSSSSSPLTPPVDQYTQPGQMTRSMSARGSDHHLSINIHTSTTTNNYLTNNNNNNTSAITNTRLYDSVGMKRAVSAKAATTIISTKPKPTPMEHVALLGNGANNNNNNAGVTTYGSAAMGSDKV